MARRIPKKYLLPFGVGLALSLSTLSVMAEELELGHQAPPPAQSPQAAANKDDSEGVISFWKGSFDKAGDASRDAELALKKRNFTFNCAHPEGTLSPAQVQANKARCQALEREIRQYGEEASEIRSTQRIFSDVSKASDLAAVGAIGATGYAQLGKRDPSQASTLESAAKIQETAGYVSYASGATDFSMGAYAYLAQKSKFEEMEEKLRKAKASPQVLSSLSAAAEATKQAAYSHMMYGAGKAAFGYASMYLAKQNRKQAASMNSLTGDSALATATATATTATPTISGDTGGENAALSYNNNQPTFSLGDGTKINTATASGTSTTPVFSSSGGSVLRVGDGRGLASSGFSGGGGGGGSGGSLGGAGLNAASGKAPEGEAAAESAEAAAPEKASGYEINTMGGIPHFGGGGGSKSSGGDETAGAIASLLSNTLGGNAAGSAGTGVNPNELYRDATSEEGAEGQSSEAGVSSANNSLFEVVKVRYAKIIQGGRVIGPGAVEVRN